MKHSKSRVVAAGAVFLVFACIGGIFFASSGTVAGKGEGVSVSAHSTTSQAATAFVPVVDVTELNALLHSSAPPRLIDVREPQEHAAGSIPNDTNIPLGELAQRAGEIPKDKPVVVYCHSGRRSAEAVKLLAGMGYANVKGLSGGYQAWAGPSACDGKVC